MAREKVHAELQLQNIRYDRLLGSVNENDNKMTKLIKSNLNEKIAIILQEQCTKQCQTGEFKFIQEFSKKE